MTLAHVSSPDAAVAPLVALLLHGYGSDERDLAGLAPYVPGAVAWASVRAPMRHPAFGYAWYALEGAEFGAQADVEAATDQLWEWVDEALDPGAMLIPIGFSQGGMMASQLLRTRPERVLGAAILSGYVLGAEQQGDATLSESLPPVMWARGTADQMIPAKAVVHAEAWLPAHATVESHIYQGMGHTVSEQELQHLRIFLATLGPAT